MMVQACFCFEKQELYVWEEATSFSHVLIPPVPITVVYVVCEVISKLRVFMRDDFYYYYSIILWI